ncbi:putative non-specific serine/threonine protein kinase [Helianthus annuus]|nr:putative non-specific serine/threonine protein kinase [Helianthus annuus]
MVRVRQFSELEKVIDYCTIPVGALVAEGRRTLIRNMWNERIKGTKRNVEVCWCSSSLVAAQLMFFFTWMMLGLLFW